MSRILRTNDNSRCKACNTAIPFGTNVRHTGGYGVTCMDCPHAPDLAPQQAQPPAAGVAAQLTEQLTEIARLNEALALARQTYRQQREEIATLQREVVRQNSLVQEAVAVSAALKADRRVGPLAQLPVEDPAEDENDGELDDDLIDVMAPGGVEAWLAADLARIAAEKAAAPAVDEDDDCPI